MTKQDLMMRHIGKLQANEGGGQNTERADNNSANLWTSLSQLSFKETRSCFLFALRLSAAPPLGLSL